VRLRDIAASLGITERSAHGIVTDLAAAGYVVKQRDGRRNRYQIQATSRCQNPLAGAALSARCWTLATMDPRRYIVQCGPELEYLSLTVFAVARSVAHIAAVRGGDYVRSVHDDGRLDQAVLCFFTIVELANLRLVGHAA
jgi:hypothetical protein